MHCEFNSTRTAVLELTVETVFIKPDRLHAREPCVGYRKPCIATHPDFGFSCFAPRFVPVIVGRHSNSSSRQLFPARQSE